MEKLVFDTSVAVDLFAGWEELRVVSAEKVFGCVARGVVGRLRDEVTLVGDDLYFTEAVETALATGSRGADSYYIGLARTLNAPLATSDRVQALNAKKSKIKAFYILDKQDLEGLLDNLNFKI
ncbi:MAG: hypothetical protein F7C38_05400 [Desulfurococcales archaeon]|nr:hypothetical protein [Desulfurococcales archaeon]